jgi:hypothetical protein
MPRISPRAQVQVDVVDDHTLGPRRVVHAPVAHLHHHVADGRLARRVAVGHGAADHAADDAVLVGALLAAVDGFHRGAVAQHGHGVGHARHLAQLVRDEDAGDALRLQVQQQRQQRLAVAFVQAGGGLVQDQQAHALGQRLGNLHQLLLANAQLAHRRGRRLLQAHALQQFGPRGGAWPRRPPRRGRAISWPRNRFSAIDSCGTRASSWWMMMMPSASLSRMPAKRRSWPSKTIWPS